MIITFLDPNPNPNDPYSSCLFFYAITSLPPRLAEGSILYNALNDQIFGVQTHELPVNTFEEAIEALVTSLYMRGLLKAFTTHKHNGLTTPQSPGNDYLLDYKNLCPCNLSQSLPVVMSRLGNVQDFQWPFHGHFQLWKSGLVLCPCVHVQCDMSQGVWGPPSFLSISCPGDLFICPGSIIPNTW
jgi:hypothetical protein